MGLPAGYLAATSRLTALTGYLVEVHLNLLAAPHDFRQLGYHQSEASNPDERATVENLIWLTVRVCLPAVDAFRLFR